MNLQQYYSRSQVINLLGYDYRCKGILRIGGVLFYPRNVIDEHLRLSAKKPTDLFKINAQIIGTPAYNLNLDEWIPFGEAVRIVPFTADMVIATAATRDLLKPIRARKVYDMYFYNKQDLLRLLATKNKARYYNISHSDAMALTDNEPITIHLPRTHCGAWYTPREARIVLGVTRRQQLVQFDDVYWFGGQRFIHHTAIHAKKANNWTARAAYIYHNRLYDQTTTKWSDWLALRDIKQFTYWSRGKIRSVVKENNITTLDLGGVLAYNKDQWLNWYRTQLDKIYFPFKAGDIQFSNREMLMEYMDAVQQNRFNYNYN